MQKNYVVWYSKHYNKFLRTNDLVLTCEEGLNDNTFPIQVFADDLNNAKELCKMFFKDNQFILKSAF